MNVMITDSARWQLRLTIRDLLRKKDSEASQLAQRLRGILTNPILLQDSLQPLEGMAELPHHEIVLGSYHLYFREMEGTVWLTALWPPMYPE
ncbi:hypothetical protein KKG90_05325 [Candidatus Bipolaricaulota bacterium]|nr:hypothetical protein [Candidatus Bipolaricaulota bacterium]